MPQTVISVCCWITILSAKIGGRETFARHGGVRATAARQKQMRPEGRIGRIMGWATARNEGTPGTRKVKASLMGGVWDSWAV